MKEFSWFLPTAAAWYALSDDSDNLFSLRKHLLKSVLSLNLLKLLNGLPDSGFRLIRELRKL